MQFSTNQSPPSQSDHVRCFAEGAASCCSSTARHLGSRFIPQVDHCVPHTIQRTLLCHSCQQQLIDPFKMQCSAAYQSPALRCPVLLSRYRRRCHQHCAPTQQQRRYATDPNHQFQPTFRHCTHRPPTRSSFHIGVLSENTTHPTESIVDDRDTHNGDAGLCPQCAV